MTKKVTYGDMRALIKVLSQGAPVHIATSLGPLTIRPKDATPEALSGVMFIETDGRTAFCADAPVALSAYGIAGLKHSIKEREVDFGTRYQLGVKPSEAALLKNMPGTLGDINKAAEHVAKIGQSDSLKRLFGTDFVVRKTYSEGKTVDNGRFYIKVGSLALIYYGLPVSVHNYELTSKGELVSLGLARDWYERVRTEAPYTERDLHMPERSSFSLEESDDAEWPEGQYVGVSVPCLPLPTGFWNIIAFGRISVTGDNHVAVSAEHFGVDVSSLKWTAQKKPDQLATVYRLLVSPTLPTFDEGVINASSQWRWAARQAELKCVDLTYDMYPYANGTLRQAVGHPGRAILAPNPGRATFQAQVVRNEISFTRTGLSVVLSLPSSAGREGTVKATISCGPDRVEGPDVAVPNSILSLDDNFWLTSYPLGALASPAIKWIGDGAENRVREPFSSHLGLKEVAKNVADNLAARGVFGGADPDVKDLAYQDPGTVRTYVRDDPYSATELFALYAFSVANPTLAGTVFNILKDSYAKRK